MPVALCVPENAAYDTAPGVCDTFWTTVPVASSVSVGGSVAPPSSVFTKTARVPELAGRLMTVIT